MSISTNLLKSLHQRPISYYPIYKDITGSTTAGVLLSQLMYWFSKKDKIFKTDEEIRDETGLTEKEMRNAKKIIKNLSFITVSKEGIPAKTYYEIDWNTYTEALAQRAKQETTKGQDCTSPKGETVLAQRAKQETTKGQDCTSPKGETIIVKSFDRDYTETTTKTTTDIKIKNKNISTVPQKPMEHETYEKRICDYFDRKKQSIQPNFLRSENDAEYLLRLEFEKGRTSEQFKGAIDYLFSGRENMQFWVGAINTVAGLIKNFNAIEAKSIAEANSPKNIKLNEEAIAYANVFRKQGMSEEDIILELRKSGLVA